eukprot:2862155-Rhodomonas_salina.4
MPHAGSELYHGVRARYPLAEARYPRTPREWAEDWQGSSKKVPPPPATRSLAATRSLVVMLIGCYAIPGTDRAPAT